MTRRLEVEQGPVVRVDVVSGERDYPVLVGAGILGGLSGLLDGVGARRFAFIADENVARLHAESLADRCRDDGLDVVLLTFPAGEASKTRKTWSILTDEMLDAGLGRDAAVVGIGGGVTTDLAGFVAATFMRGIPVVQVPTSYLAMIDASVGGKTGVDVRAGKNLVGAFHAPELVLADPAVLATLPDTERRQGLVEAFKHGAILDPAYFDDLSSHLDALLAADPDSALRAVERSVVLKAEVVREDEREGGRRQILNFGHTIGHAVEAASDFALGHGSAVALGMIVEATLGERIGITQQGCADRLRAAMMRLAPARPGAIDPARVLGFLAADKKVRDGRARFVLLRAMGEVDPGDRWTHELPEPLVRDVLGEVFGGA